MLELMFFIKTLNPNKKPQGKSALEATKEEKVDNQNCVKPADKVEPKFKVNDWVVFNNKHQSIYQVEKIEDGYYILRHTHGGTFRVCVLHDESLRHWTIQDAKDGDVLVDGNLPFLFKKIDANKYSYAYCGISGYNGFKIEPDGKSGEWTWVQDIKPATKEQRDLLFQKMKEAGYEWDAEKKELKKIEQKPVECSLEEAARIFLKALSETPYNNKPITDAQIVTKELLKFFSNAKTYNPDALHEQKPEWSEEDEFMFRKAIITIDNVRMNTGLSEYYQGISKWLKSLKDRVQLQPQQEWSEEDIKVIKEIIFLLKHYNSNEVLTTVHSIEDMIDFLKSLRPQSQWKPSEEQMVAVQEAMNIVGILTITGSKINSLYQDLKKLKG